MNLAEYFNDPVHYYEITVESDDGKERQQFWQHMTKTVLGEQIRSIFEIVARESKFKDLTNIRIRILD